MNNKIKPQLYQQPSNGKVDSGKNIQQQSFEKEVTMRTIIQTVLIMLGIAGLIAIAYMQSEKLIKQQAITGCMQAGRVEMIQNAKTTAVVPEEYWFNQCLERIAKQEK